MENNFTKNTKKVGIYKITCTANNKIYIGSSSNIYQRWHRHKSNFRLNVANKNIQNSYNKYGNDTFLFEIIEECLVDSLIEREQYWFDFYKANGCDLLNCGEIVSNPTRGTTLSKEKRNNISAKNLGKNNPSFNKIWIHNGDDYKYIKKEDFDFYAENGYVRGLTNTHKLKISKRQTEIARKMTDSNKLILLKFSKKPKTFEHKSKISKTRTMLLGVKVRCVQTNEVFDSYTSAAKKYKTSYQSIRQSILRGGTSAKLNFEKIK